MSAKRHGAPFDARMALLQVCLAACVAGVVVWAAGRPANRRSATADPELLRECAAKLQAAGLPQQAEEAYGEYLAAAGATGEKAANVYYLMGKLALDDGRYEDALAHLYKAEAAGPGPEVARNIGPLVVEALEKSGRSFEAQGALRSRAGLDEPQTEPGAGAVAARIGDEEITAGQVRDAAALLPQWQRPDLSKPDQAAQFLQEFIAQKALARKARRLGYDKDPAFRRRVDSLTESMLAQRVVEDEVKALPDVTDSEARMYYDANPDRFTEPARAKVAAFRFDDKGAAEAAAGAVEAALAAGDIEAVEPSEGATLPERVDAELSAGRPRPDLGIDADALVAVLGSDAGKALVFENEEGAVLVGVTDVTPEAVHAFEDAAEDARQAYAAQRAREAVGRLMQDATAAADVQLFPAALTGPGGQ